MCRLFGMQATHPTRIDCELLESQNALIHQARRDQRGIVNADGWGIGLVLASGAVECARQPQPAYQSEDYRAEAARSPAVAAIAHVRAATVGGGALENTHPFRHGDALFAHNGDVPRFDAVKRLRPLRSAPRASAGGRALPLGGRRLRADHRRRLDRGPRRLGLRRRARPAAGGRAAVRALASWICFLRSDEFSSDCSPPCALSVSRSRSGGGQRRTHDCLRRFPAFWRWRASMGEVFDLGKGEPAPVAPSAGDLPDPEELQECEGICQALRSNRLKSSRLDRSAEKVYSSFAGSARDETRRALEVPASKPFR